MSGTPLSDEGDRRVQLLEEARHTPEEVAAIVSWETLRPTVRRLATRMESNLQANDHKGGWSIEEAGFLFAKLAEECGELAEAYTDGGSPGMVWDEAADVANVAMMLADIARHRSPGCAGGLLAEEIDRCTPPAIAFTDKLATQVAHGKKTRTTRIKKLGSHGNWEPCRYLVGETYAVFKESQDFSGEELCRVRVQSVRQVNNVYEAGFIDGESEHCLNRHARLEGFGGDIDAFYRTWFVTYPHDVGSTPAWVVDFVLVGGRGE